MRCFRGRWTKGTVDPLSSSTNLSFGLIYSTNRSQTLVPRIAGSLIASHTFKVTAAW